MSASRYVRPCHISAGVQSVLLVSEFKGFRMLSLQSVGACDIKRFLVCRVEGEEEFEERGVVSLEGQV